MYLSRIYIYDICTSKFAPKGQFSLSSEQAGGTECSFVCHAPGPRSTRHLSSFLRAIFPQQGIVSMFFSGVGRQPI